jgi:hypothetical protein
MSFDKVAELAKEFTIKLAENQYANKAPADKKASDFSPEEAAFIKSLSKKDNNQVQDENEIDEKVWKRAKKAVKKYWKKYDEPWAVVYDVYKKMGGKAKKKSKKKADISDSLIQKYSYYGEIKNTIPVQNHTKPDAKSKATQAVYNLLNTLYNEKQQGRFVDNVALEESYGKIGEFYQSLLAEGKRPKFELYDEAVSDPIGFSILEEDQLASRGGPKLTKIDRMLNVKSENLRRHLNEANEAVRELKQETRS